MPHPKGVSSIKCTLCPTRVYNMSSLEAHMLFSHSFLTPRCGTDVAERQNVRDDKIRKAYKTVNNRISGIRSYLRRKHAKSTFSNTGDSRYPSVLERWLDYAGRGDGWLYERDEHLHDFAEYDKVRDDLIRLYRFGSGRKKILEYAEKNGILIE